MEAIEAMGSAAAGSEEKDDSLGNDAAAALQPQLDLLTAQLADAKAACKCDAHASDFVVLVRGAVVARCAFADYYCRRFR